MTNRTLRAAEIFRDGEAFHFTRGVLSRGIQHQPHDHDFYELFWVSNGAARHDVAGQRRILVEGDLVFMRPSDRHAIHARDRETHIVSIAIRPGLIDDVGHRHGLKGRYFWADGDLPAVAHRTPRQLAALSGRALILEAGPGTTLAIEAFLLPLIAELEAERHEIPDDVPAWLAKALVRARDPDVFRLGASGLVQASGRTHAHVSRTVRRHFGLTPSELMNRIRMDHAARALTGGSDGLEDIARECGISNLSHFHRLFRGRFDMTPAQYRRRFQKNALQPI